MRQIGKTATPIGLMIGNSQNGTRDYDIREVIPSESVKEAKIKFANICNTLAVVKGKREFDPKALAWGFEQLKHIEFTEIQIRVNKLMANDQEMPSMSTLVNLIKMDQHRQRLADKENNFDYAKQSESRSESWQKLRIAAEVYFAAYPEKLEHCIADLEIDSPNFVGFVQRFPQADEIIRTMSWIHHTDAWRVYYDAEIDPTHQAVVESRRRRAAESGYVRCFQEPQPKQEKPCTLYKEPAKVKPRYSDELARMARS